MTRLPTTISNQDVGLALKEMRDGNWLALAESPLAALPLVDGALLIPDSADISQRSRALRTTLTWSIAQLKPNGQQSWHNNAWRHYNILHYYYVGGWRVAELAESLTIADQTFYEWRPQAVDALSHFLNQRDFDSERIEQLRRFAQMENYQSQPVATQKMMRLLALLPDQKALPLSWAHLIDPSIRVSDVVPHFDQTGWVTVNREHQTVLPHPSLKSALRSQIADVESATWLRRLGRQFIVVDDAIAAAICYRDAKDVLRAATILVENWQSIVDQKRLPELPALFQSLPQSAFSQQRDLWCELQIATGRSAEMLDDVDSAIAAYGKALAAPSLLTKARAYYRRAKVFQRRDLDESLSHHAVCIGLLERHLKLNPEKDSSELKTLLTRMMVDRAWIYIQERPNLDRAEQDLSEAEKIIPPLNSSLWSDLYNAWASLYFHRDSAEKGLEYRLQAWVAACESQQITLMTKTAYNLGTDYLWQSRYDKGLEYLQKALDLAYQGGDQQMQGLSFKGLGNCYFYEENYQEAHDQYLRSYAVFAEMGNDVYRAGVCFDLTEVNVVLDNWPSARKYFSDGQAVAKALEHSRYQKAFANLAEHYPRLILVLSDRQREAVNVAKEQGGIRRSQYIVVTGVSKSQAHRDLEELCQQGVLVRVGKGRATKYIIPS